MLIRIAPLFSPLLSIMILMLGSGLLGTLLPLRLRDAGETIWTIGLISSGYYVGQVFGSFNNASFILRVGHIRAYATFASLIAVAILIQGMFYNPPFWIVIRIIQGYCLTGLFIVIESWLLNSGTPQTRGQFLALYMISLYGAQAMGQFLINEKYVGYLFPIEQMLGSLKYINTIIPFCIATILCSLSVVPLSMTTTMYPQIEEPSALGLKELYSQASTGLIGCFIAGLMLSCIYSLLPLHLQKLGQTNITISLNMFLVIFGGMALQYPVGRISDIINRGYVVIALSIITVLLCSTLMFIPKEWEITLGLGFFLLGGALFTIYPICINHACDNLVSKDIVSATQGLILAYGLGCILGPITASEVMEENTKGLFIYLVVLSFIMGAFFLWRTVTIRIPRTGEDSQTFVSMPTTTPVAAELAPSQTDDSDGVSNEEAPPLKEG